MLKYRLKQIVLGSFASKGKFVLKNISYMLVLFTFLSWLKEQKKKKKFNNLSRVVVHVKEYRLNDSVVHVYASINTTK